MVTKRQCGIHNKAWFSLAAQEQGQAKGSYGDVIAVETAIVKCGCFFYPCDEKTESDYKTRRKTNLFWVRDIF